MAMNLADEVRGIVATDPAAVGQRMSVNENRQLPLHFAVRKNRPDMLALLFELGADPAATDGYGAPAAVYGATPEVDRRVLARLGGKGAADLFIALALDDQTRAARLPRENPGITKVGGASAGTLRLLAKRGNASAMRWLLDRGVDPSAVWSHWDAEVTPLHLAALHGHAEVVRLLLEAGADPKIRDSRQWQCDGLGRTCRTSGDRRRSR